MIPTTVIIFLKKVVSVDYVRPSGVLTIENNNPVAGTFDAVVSNIVSPTGLKEVLVPSWSLENGQDDLIWHKATRQADGSYRVTIKATDHKRIQLGITELTPTL